MMLQRIEASELAIPFKGAFKHASAERHAMQSLWVTVTDANGGRGYGEGCPREYVTGESISSALTFVERHRADWLANIQDVRALRHWVEQHAIAIDAHPAAWAAVELAFLDLFGKLQPTPTISGGTPRLALPIYGRCHFNSWRLRSPFSPGTLMAWLK